MTGWADLPMAVVAAGCPLVRSDVLERVMGGLVFLGHGLADGGIAVAILAYGALTRNRRVARTGLAALAAVVAAGLLADILKVVFQWPRPTPTGTYGFPSGHTTTAFALAATLGHAFPEAAPFLYLLAVLAGAARLYARSHFVIDVLGGSFLGTVAGVLAGRAIGGPSGARDRPARRRWAWALPLVVGLVALAFFAAYERALAASRPAAAPSLTDSYPSLVITFGTAQAHPFLLEGWSRDETWDARIPIAWAERRAAAVGVPLTAPAEYRLRLRLRPYAQPGRGVPCQVMDAALNGAPVGRLLLERGWADYELKIPRGLARAGDNELAFRFAYAERPPGDTRALSAAFASLALYRKGG